MKCYLFPIILGLSTSLCADVEVGSLANSVQENPYHIEVSSGLEVFTYKIKADIGDLSLKGHPVFFGSRVRLEYVKPDYLYAGFDFLASQAFQEYKVSGDQIHWERYPSDRGYSNIDLRLGYTFAKKQHRLIPFVGGGVSILSNIDSHLTKGFFEYLPYIAVGIRSNYALLPIFHVGLNTKILKTYDGVLLYRTKLKPQYALLNAWGGEIGIPITLHFDHKLISFIQCEPFITKLSFLDVQKIRGGRLLFGMSY